ncbi:MAG: nucleotidyl transferase AbiEii/AbiGii toxin family protein [Chitinophagaceae bacterium]
MWLNMLREYLQHKILQIIYDSVFSSKLAFVGRTCLRIVRGNTRFSEDIDFDNFNIGKNTFEEVADSISKEL